tara:strand:- start:15 stop:560 length:546 start_codon:yes stop_codon:yes gene_type:complete
MICKKILFFILSLVHVNGYNFYKNCLFKTLHVNEPKIFQNMDHDDIIAMSKKYDIPYENQNPWKIKEDLYKIYMKHKKIYVIDIDNTICKSRTSNYIDSIPHYDIINSFNKLYEHGHELHYWTARGSVSGKDWSDFTLRQMKMWGVKYSTLNIGKLHYDIWVDDKAINIDDWILDIDEIYY